MRKCPAGRLGLLVVLLSVVVACAGAPYRAGQFAGELPPASPDSRLTAQFFGVSTLLLSDGQTAIMSDGFFSRPALIQALAPLRPNAQAIERALARGRVDLGRVKAVLVAHSHYDHALDAGTVAGKTDDATVFGSPSTCRILRAERFPLDRTGMIEGGEQFESGTFKVRVFHSKHTPPPPWPIPALSREIDAGFKAPAWITEYEEGGTYSFLIEHGGRTVLIHGSTNFVPGLYEGVHADVVFLGVALLSRQGDVFADNYWKEVVTTTGARLVIPVHWDDLTRQLDKPLRLLGWPDHVEDSMAMIRKRAEASNVAVAFMPLFDPVDVLSAAPTGPAERRLPPPPVMRQPRPCPP